MCSYTHASTHMYTHTHTHICTHTCTHMYLSSCYIHRELWLQLPGVSGDWPELLHYLCCLLPCCYWNPCRSKHLRRPQGWLPTVLELITDSWRSIGFTRSLNMWLRHPSLMSTQQHSCKYTNTRPFSISPCSLFSKYSECKPEEKQGGCWDWATTHLLQS